MGTRADFYLGRGQKAKWLGSIGFDGYPDGPPSLLIRAKTESSFLAAIERLKRREDYTSPEEGWPWPWTDSSTSDYAYAWDEGVVWVTSCGCGWIAVPRDKIGQLNTRRLHKLLDESLERGQKIIDFPLMTPPNDPLARKGAPLVFFER